MSRAAYPQWKCMKLAAAIDRQSNCLDAISRGFENGARPSSHHAGVGG